MTATIVGATAQANKIFVPDDLTSVTTYDPKQEANPSWLGMKADASDKIWRAAEALYQTGFYPGLALCVRRHGEVVLNRAIGHASGNGPGDIASEAETRLITPDTPMCLFSASKAVTAMLVHYLAERNDINLMDKVSHYLPEFGVAGKQSITIHQILCHKAGVYEPPKGFDPQDIFDTQKIWQGLCEAKPNIAHGRSMAYHAITGGFILGELIRVVTGKDIRDVIHELIVEPMGMRYFNYGLYDRQDPENDVPVAKNYVTGWRNKLTNAYVRRLIGAELADVVHVSNDPRFLDVAIPAGNIISTAEEASRFFQLLLNHGEFSESRIFDPRTVQRAVQEADAKFDRMFLAPMRYSAGMMLGNKLSAFGPMTEHAYGHVGMTNNLCWADPERDIAVALLTSGNPVLGGHLPYLMKFVTTLALHCDRVYKL